MQYLNSSFHSSFHPRECPHIQLLQYLRKKALSLAFFVVLKGKMNYTLLSLEGDKDMDIGIVENKLISLLQFPFCSNRSKYGEINSENWRKICKTKLGLVLVSVIHFPFPVLYIHSTYMQQKVQVKTTDKH